MAKKKTRTAISIDEELLDRTRSFVELTERRGGVSGLIEDAVKIMLPFYMSTGCPDIVTSTERAELKHRLLLLMRDMKLSDGNYSGEYEEDIQDALVEIAECKEIDLEAKR